MVSTTVLATLQTKSQAELMPFLCHDSIFRTFLECFLVTYFLEFLIFWTSETCQIHIVILLVEFLVIYTGKTWEIHFTIEHVTRNVHFSREITLSILCTQLMLFPRNTYVTNLYHSWVLFGGHIYRYYVQLWCMFLYNGMLMYDLCVIKTLPGQELTNVFYLFKIWLIYFCCSLVLYYLRL